MAATSIDRLRQRVRDRPDDGESWLDLAQELARAEGRKRPSLELNEAIDRAITLLPDSEAAWMLAADAHCRRAGPAAAERWLELIAGQLPDVAAPRLVRARMLLELGQPRAAADAAAAAVAAAPDSLAARSVRADARRQSGLWSPALTDYRQVEKSRPQDPALANHIGCCLAGLARFEEADEYFNKALRLRPEFHEAKLNLALSCAAQSRGDEAIARIREVLRDPSVLRATRQAAEAIAAILSEHRRLRPHLEQVLASGNVADLHRELQRTPAGIAQPDPETIRRLRDLADRCCALVSNPPRLGLAADARMLPFIEACFHCKIPADPERLAGIYKQLDQPAEPAAPSAELKQLSAAWRAVCDRRKSDLAAMYGESGEAWLRYWQARLVAALPHSSPGQLKAISNAIGGRRLTPPERVAGTLRTLLAEIQPGVPPGLPRAVLWYVALNWIHGFVDGNGRLSRFLLAWETETSAGQAVLIPPALRRAAGRAMDSAWLDGDTAPLVQLLESAVARTDHLLREFNRALPPESPSHPPVR